MTLYEKLKKDLNDHFFAGTSEIIWQEEESRFYNNGRITLYPRYYELMADRLSEYVKNELHKAIAKHKGMNSPHEAYAVLLEEMDEFWDEVKKQTHSKSLMYKELLQISAMAQRAIIDLDLMPVELTKKERTK